MSTANEAHEFPDLHAMQMLEAIGPARLIDEEVWLRIFLAALGCFGVTGKQALSAADNHLRAYRERFPSDESKP